MHRDTTATSAAKLPSDAKVSSSSRYVGSAILIEGASPMRLRRFTINAGADAHSSLQYSVMRPQMVRQIRLDGSSGLREYRSARFNSAAAVAFDRGSGAVANPKTDAKC